MIPKPGSVHREHAIVAANICARTNTLCSSHCVMLTAQACKKCPRNRNEVTIVVWSCWVCVVLSSVCIWCTCSTSSHSQTTFVCWCALRSGANENCVRCASHQNCAAGTKAFLSVHVGVVVSSVATFYHLLPPPLPVSSTITFTFFHHHFHLLPPLLAFPSSCLLLPSTAFVCLRYCLFHHVVWKLSFIPYCSC